MPEPLTYYREQCEKCADECDRLHAELAEVKAHSDELQTELEHFRTQRDALRAKCAVYEKALEFYASGENIYVGTLGLQEGKHGGPLGTIARAALAPSGGGTE